jgi:hypothetical protein
MELQFSGKIKITDEVVQRAYLESLKENRNTIEEYINDGVHFPENKNYSQISIDQTYLDFGASKVDANDEDFNPQKSITLFNNTKSKMLIFWNTGSENQSFIILPTKCEIPPMKSYSFRVKFLPKVADQFYSNKLEGYAIYKSLCDYTIAEPQFIMPSSCLNIDCLGHTFHPSNDTFFTPRYIIDSENIIFPSTVKNKAVYRTYSIKNVAPNCPLVFDFCNLNNK